MDSIEYAVKETDCWVEITTLLIPGENDSAKEIAALSQWVVDKIGVNKPLHFSAFHPDHKMMDKPRTPKSSLLNARKIARAHGIQHVYIGNAHDVTAQSSYCSGCGTCVIKRDWYELFDWKLDDFGHCITCGTHFPGHIDGPPGTWGEKTQACPTDSAINDGSKRLSPLRLSPYRQ